MKEYNILLVEEKIQGKIETVLDSYDVEGIELDSCWEEPTPRRLFSGVFPLAGKDGIGFSFCVEVHMKCALVHEDGTVQSPYPAVHHYCHSFA